MSKVWPDITISDDKDQNPAPMQMTEAVTLGKNLRIAHVCIVNSSGELLLQKRGPNIIAPNLWNASAAGHVEFGDSYEATAIKELQEEMGILLTESDLTHVGVVHLMHSMNGYDHGKFHTLFVASSDETVTPNPEEVSDYAWLPIKNVVNDTQAHPEKYTEIFVQFMTDFGEVLGKH